MENAYTIRLDRFSGELMDLFAEAQKRRLESDTRLAALRDRLTDSLGRYL